MSDIQIVCRTYKEFTPINNKKTTQKKTKALPKQTYKWPTNS